MAEALAAAGPRRAADARPGAAALTTRQTLALLAIFAAGLALRIPRLINAAPGRDCVGANQIVR